MNTSKTGNVVSSAHVKSDNVKDMFTVFCWNVLDVGGRTDFRKTAMMNELSTPPRDLVFLQEMNVQPDGQKRHEYIPNEPYGSRVHYKEELSDNIYNVILYNTEKFEEESDFKPVLFDSYYSLQLQVDCYRTWFPLNYIKENMFSSGWYQSAGEMVNMEGADAWTIFKEIQTKREKYEKVNEERMAKNFQLMIQYHEALKVIVGPGPTWEKLQNKVAKVHTEEKITKGVQYIARIWGVSTDELCMKTLLDRFGKITYNCDFLNLKSEIEVLHKCLQCENTRRNAKKPPKTEGSDFWTGILKDVTYHFALTCLTYKKDKGDVIIAVSFHNRKDQPKEMLHVLLYLLREFRTLLKARYQEKRFHILLAGDFNTDLFIYNPYTRKPEPKDHLLKPYNPQPCQATGRRRKEIDYILLWPDNDTWKLESVEPHIIDIPRDVKVDLPENDPDWKHVDPDYDSGKDDKRELVKLVKRLTFAEQVSNHDPLEATLTIVKVNKEHPSVKGTPTDQFKKENKKTSNQAGFKGQ